MSTCHDSHVIKALWGTGTTAELVLDHIASDFEYAVASNPKSNRFRSLDVLMPEEILTSRPSQITVASMFYPEILSRIKKLALHTVHLNIYTGHLINPNFLLTEVPLEEAWRHSSNFEQGPGEPERALLQKISKSEASIKAYGDRLIHLRDALRLAPKVGLALEFGVHRGDSLQYLRSHTQRKIIGFDSLVGFDVNSQFSNWEFHVPVTGVDEEALKKLAEDPDMQVGFFQHTLHAFLEVFDSSIDFIHYDAADQASCDYVLRSVLPRLSDGAIIVFDDLIPHQSDLESAELRALTEVLDDSEFRYEVVSWVPNGTQVAIRLAGC
jgi:hypothetical protein